MCLLIIFQRGSLYRGQPNEKVNREKGIDDLYRVRGSTARAMVDGSRV